MIRWTKLVVGHPFDTIKVSSAFCSDGLQADNDRRDVRLSSRGVT